MAHVGFVHLRVHSSYSLSEGAIHVKDLANLAAEKMMPAVAVTDTNNIFGALEFSDAAAKSGVQPIIGCQLSIVGTRVGSGDPMVFLVVNETGYRNLLKLLSFAYLGTGDTCDPHVTLDILENHSEGLIALTGGFSGPVGKLIENGQNSAAKSLVERFLSIFGNRLYIEIQRHGLELGDRTEAAFIELAYQFGIPLVATNDVYFSTPDMFDAHDALICIAEGAYLSQDDRRRVTPHHFLKSADEMITLFTDLPEAIENTIVIAKRCAFMVESIAPILPPFDCGEDRNEEEELRTQAKNGLNSRLDSHVLQKDIDPIDRDAAIKPYRHRLEYELGIISQMGFSGYFLIVADFIQWAKDQGIPVGPGRGSGAGSVVAWALKITDLDPLHWGLLFERFLNPERVSMPDFDIDFCQDRRDEVIRYVQNKYGRNRVAQIITFGKLQARAVLRDCGRVLGMRYEYVDKISKLVPNNPANPVTLGQAIEGEPELQKMISSDPDVGRLVDIARRLEGMYRHASTHAAGVVIADRPLDELIPLYRDPRSDMPVTGFNMKFVELAGLVKFDFLGLKTLTVLSTAEKLVRSSGVKLDLSSLSLTDVPTYDMISRGETTGVFQLESAGMRDVLRGMKPDTFEDIIAVVALYRPGPMDNIPSYVERKHGREKPDYLHPTLEPILKETFGIMIYQEQVMQIAQKLSGYTLGGADLLRRAMGKKIQIEMDEQRQAFISGAKKRGVSGERSNEIFAQVNKFAGYGFNKSHAAAYAMIAYQTAYMKANHPVEFLAASMTLDMGNTDKLNVFKQELVRLGIPIFGPDINKSGANFKVETLKGHGTGIRYALAALKNVGCGAMEWLVRERKDNGAFADITDFVRRIDTHQINKRQLENLVRAGALDSIEINRRSIYEGIELLMRHAAAAQSDRESNQMGLFAGETSPLSNIFLPETSDWPAIERLREEFDAVGFYLSAHPLDAYSSKLKTMKIRPSASLVPGSGTYSATLAGNLIAKKERTSARGNRYAFVQFSDPSGVFEATVFSETLLAAKELLEVGNSLIIKCTVQAEKNDDIKILANQFACLEQSAQRTTEHLRIVVSERGAIASIQRILAKQNPGRGKIRINTCPVDAKWHADLELPGYFNLTPDAQLALRALPGVINVEPFDTRHS
ncbi:MAG: DNA polymerase III subunit alpha [Magnetovibrio sp.]|nr:DNA polymerase III subunit alpha [Magnetovibrio sp.]